MGVHLDKGKASIRLKSSLDDKPEILKERDEIVLSGIGCEISDIAGSLPLWRLLNDHVEALHPVRREVMMSVRRGRRHPHGGHLGLLRHGRLALLVGPVAADGARAKPFAVHGVQCLLSVGPFTKRNEAVTPRSTGLHIPHHSGLRDGPKGGEGLQENFIVDLVGQVSDKDMKVI